jgi:hypothetical protein
MLCIIYGLSASTIGAPTMDFAIGVVLRLALRAGVCNDVQFDRLSFLACDWR